jgi:2-iminobutanoate/2-iminopropanoate deaminase
MKEIIATVNAPQAIGPYSQAVRVNNTVYLSGQIPLHPQNGQVAGESVRDQTRQVLENIKAVLAESGLQLSDVVKTTVFMTELGQFGEMNEVYAHYFGSQPPARSTVEVSRLPRNVQVEIEAIASAEK